MAEVIQPIALSDTLTTYRDRFNQLSSAVQNNEYSIDSAEAIDLLNDKSFTFSIFDSDGVTSLLTFRVLDSSL